MRGRTLETPRDKAALRAEILARRDNLPPANRRTASARIRETCLGHPAIARAASLFVYVSTPREVDTHRLIDHLLAAGRTVLVPLIRDREQMTAVPFPGWSCMRPGQLGILTPPALPPWDGTVDAALVPGVAFTAGGARLGYGRGYYDRWLSTHPATTAIALAFELQVVDKLPLDSHDMLIPTIITERRTITGGEGGTLIF